MQADRVELKISKEGTTEKKSRPSNCLSGLPYPQSLLPEVVNEIPNKPNLNK